MDIDAKYSATFNGLDLLELVSSVDTFLLDDSGEIYHVYSAYKEQDYINSGAITDHSFNGGTIFKDNKFGNYKIMSSQFIR